MDIIELKLITFAHIVERTNLTKAEKLQILEFAKNASQKQLTFLLTKGRMLTENELLREDDVSLPSEVLKSIEGPPVKVVVGNSFITTITKGAADAVNAAVKSGKSLFAKGSEGSPEHYGMTDQGDLEAKKAVPAVPPGALAGMENALIVTGAAGLLAVGYMIYRRYLSKAARACKTLQGPARTDCIKKFKVEAKTAEMNKLNSLKSSCGKETTPERKMKCAAKLQKRILKIQGDVKALRMKK